MSTSVRDPDARLGVTALAYGVKIRFCVARPQLPSLRRRLPPGSRIVPERNGAGGWVISTDAEVDSAVAAAELYVAEHAPGLIFVHAAAVAFQGRALLLPGHSRAGKSTLTLALIRAGASYLSEEYAALNAAGEVVPYPRPITIRAADGEAAYLVDPDQIASIATEPVPVGLIVWTEFRAESGRDAGFEPMTAGAMMLSLIDNTVAARSRSAEMLMHCGAAVANARGLSGPRGDADTLAPRLIEELAQSGAVNDGH